tara:strand:+ start:438 stop:548 length:111 start_codon:yes stop_codon:yes gene_type:complete
MKNKTEKALLLLKFITIGFITGLGILAIINEIQKTL